MPNWREEYLSSLRESELSNPVNMELVQACKQTVAPHSLPPSANLRPGSQMGDRISALEAEKVSLMASSRPRDPSAPSAELSSGDPGVAQLRQDLAEALRSKGISETRLRNAEEELDKLRGRAKSDYRAIKELTADRTTLTTRLKDREYELKEKRKLLEVL